MKKTFIFIAILITCIPLTLYGCKKSKVNDDYYSLVSFESYEELVYMDFNNFIGDVSLSTDKKFITQGENSLKLDIQSPTFDNWLFRSYNRLAAPLFSVKKKSSFMPQFDIKEIDAITIDVFNVNDKTLYLTLELLDSAKARKFTDIVPLKPKSSITATFNINQRFYEESWDDITEFVFKIQDNNLLEESCLIYFDNLRLKVAKTSDTSINKQFSANEILNFLEKTDLLYAKNYLTTKSANAYLRFSLNSPIGLPSLKLSFIGNTGSNGYGNTDYNANEEKMGFQVLDKLLNTIGFSSKKGISINVLSTDKCNRNIYLQVTDSSGKVNINKHTIKPNKDTKLTLTFDSNIDRDDIKSISVYTNCYNIFESFDLFFNNLNTF